MQALVFDAKKLQVAVEQREKPKLSNARDVLVKVAFSGVCGTDLHIIEGHFPVKSDAPVVLGHEFSGTVVEIGPEVISCKVGDRVAVNPNRGCNNCVQCHQAHPHFCPRGLWGYAVGIFRDGGFAEYAVVPQEHIHRLPEAISFAEGALSEPISCLMHGWDMLAPITVGKNILITGAGIIGNLWLVALLGQGHIKITVSEPNESRMKRLKKSFPNVDVVTPDILINQKQTVEDFGYDLAIDCSGNARAIEQCIQLLGRGGKMCIFGVAAPEARVNLAPYDLFDRELSIMAVKVNPYTFPKALGLMESLSAKSYLSYDLLGIKVFKLSEYQSAIEQLKSGTIAKAMFAL